MKRLILISVLFTFMAAPAFGNPTGDGVSPHLGGWVPGHPRATHQYWDFTKNVYTNGQPYDYYADPPTELDNPSFAKAFISGVYDGVSSFTADPTTSVIDVLMEIENFKNPAVKTIWVDIGFQGELTNFSATGTGAGLTYTTTVLSSGGPSGAAEFGFKIVPNPWKEDIFFTIGGVEATLDWIHVDTICIPAPGAVILCTIGLGLVGLLRQRKVL